MYFQLFFALDEAGDIWAVQRLRWFSNDFIKAEVREAFPERPAATHRDALNVSA